MNGRQKSDIKKYFIELVQVFEKHQLIEPNYKIISNGRIYETKELNSRNISEGFIIYEKINVNNSTIHK